MRSPSSASTPGARPRGTPAAPRRPSTTSPAKDLTGARRLNPYVTGQRLDGSTDLLYYGARYYDPALRPWPTTAMGCG